MEYGGKVMAETTGANVNLYPCNGAGTRKPKN